MGCKITIVFQFCKLFLYFFQNIFRTIFPSNLGVQNYFNFHSHQIFLNFFSNNLKNYVF